MIIDQGTLSMTSDRQRVIATLESACHHLEDALARSVPGARYDPVIIPQGLRNELSVMRDDLARMICQLKEN